MKNVYVWISILIFLFGAGSEGVKKNSLKEMNFNGKVRSVKQVSYGVKEILQGKLIRDNASIYSFTPVRIFNFNEKGNLIEETERHNNGSSFKHIYKYDDRGNEIENVFYRPDDSIEDKTLSKYDNYGNKIEEEYSDL